MQKSMPDQSSQLAWTIRHHTELRFTPRAFSSVLFNWSLATNRNLSSFHTDLKSGLQYPLEAMFRTRTGEGGPSSFLELQSSLRFPGFLLPGGFLRDSNCLVECLTFLMVFSPVRIEVLSFTYNCAIIIK